MRSQLLTALRAEIDALEWELRRCLASTANAGTAAHAIVIRNQLEKLRTKLEAIELS